MLKFISWKQFIEVGLALMGVYYVLVLLLFYRKDIRALFKKKEPGMQGGDNVVGKEKTGVTGESSPGGATKNNTPPEFLLTENIVFELKGIMKKLIQDGVDGRDLVRAMAGVLQKHRELQHTPYGKAINNFIISECGARHSVHLDEREVGKLWGK